MGELVSEMELNVLAVPYTLMGQHSVWDLPCICALCILWPACEGTARSWITEMVRDWLLPGSVKLFHTDGSKHCVNPTRQLGLGFSALHLKNWSCFILFGEQNSPQYSSFFSREVFLSFLRLIPEGQASRIQCRTQVMTGSWSESYVGVKGR